jgi:hypothetical protein
MVTLTQGLCVNTLSKEYSSFDTNDNRCDISLGFGNIMIRQYNKKSEEKAAKAQQDVLAAFNSTTEIYPLCFLDHFLHVFKPGVNVSMQLLSSNVRFSHSFFT